MQWSVIRTAIIFLAAAVLAGCGGGSSSSKNTVVQVTLTPGTLSMVAGQVAGTSVAAQNSTNAQIASTFTYNTSNPKLVTVSPAGLVCAGVWDSTFVVCNGNDASGNQVRYVHDLAIVIEVKISLGNGVRQRLVRLIIGVVHL